MQGSILAPTAIAAAASLAVVTLSIFALQQNYGPDSAVRRFELAVREKNLQALQASTTDPIDSFQVGYLVDTIRQIQASGGSLRTVRTRREGRLASVQTSINLPGGRSMDMVWIVVRQDGAWRVDARGTLNFVGM